MNAQQTADSLHAVIVAIARISENSDTLSMSDQIALTEAVESIALVLNLDTAHLAAAVAA